MELLAPAGSPAHLIAALDAGADAVYLGGKLFSARKFAGNFSNEEMKEAVHTAHVKGASVYVTLNTLIGDMEMKDLAGYLRFLGSIPIDGLLVQDFGVVEMARKIAPHIPLHASTQMTVSNLDGVKFLGDRGFQRVVLSRELSLEEIKHITSSTDVEIEVFVHGALCVCYSGQCLMSSFSGGRSGNRGSCAQPCRKEYELVDSTGHPMRQETGKYILSLKDMMGLSRIPDLLQAGVASLKVEGRMKSPEYVFNTVSAYRKAIDAAEKAQTMDTEPLKLHLEEEFNRGYSTHYLDDTPGPSMMTGYAPGNHGVDAGRVEKVSHGQFIFHGDHSRKLADVTGISYETQKQTIQFVPKEQVFPLKNKNFKVLCDVMPRKNGQVYWNVIPQKKSLAMKDLVGKIPVSFWMSVKPGQRISLSAKDEEGHHAEVTSSVIAQEAFSRVTDEKEIEAQLGRLGNTWFALKEAHIYNAGCMVPKSVLNHIRQEAISSLEKIRAKDHEARIPMGHDEPMKPVSSGKALPKDSHITVRTDSLEQLQEALSLGVRSFIFGGESFHHRPIPWEDYEKAVSYCHEKDAFLLFATPRVVRETYRERVQKQYEKLLSLHPDGIFVEYAGALEWLKESSLPLVAGPSMNLFNEEALTLIEKLGFSGAYVSQELTLPQIRDMAKKAKLPLGAYVYGRTEMMISEYCVINSVLGGVEKKKCPAPCMKHAYLLKDREGRLFPVKTDEWCHMHIQNCRLLDMRPYIPELLKAGLTSLCLDFRGLAGSIQGIVGDYMDIWSGKKMAPKPSEGDHQTITRGHFFRGVL